jgi:hypothetical protein
MRGACAGLHSGSVVVLYGDIRRNRPLKRVLPPAGRGIQPRVRAGGRADDANQQGPPRSALLWSLLFGSRQTAGTAKQQGPPNSRDRLCSALLCSALLCSAMEAQEQRALEERTADAG